MPIPARARCLSAVMMVFVLVAPANADSILSSSIPSPPVPATVWQRAQRPVAACSTPPKIDGVLDGAAWDSATHAKGFYRFVGTGPVTGSRPRC